ncbi:hypothetical protein EBZ38_03700 [bacterium]|nr:hypothetical protein [bacterium]
MKPATEWQRLLSSEQYRVGDFVQWIEDIQRDALKHAGLYCQLDVHDYKLGYSPSGRHLDKKATQEGEIACLRIKEAIYRLMPPQAPLSLQQADKPPATNEA